MVKTIALDAARRIALGAQGMAARTPTGRIDVRHFRRVMDTLGLVQLDSVNVCVRTHYMPFYSRLGPYDRAALDRWLNESGEQFEYWCHEAAVLPVDRYPLWRWKMAEARPWRRTQALIDAHPELMDSVRTQVRESGPLTVRDLDAPNHRGESWWGYGPGKQLLELLFANGEISALRTRNFVRSYDVPERMIPRDILESAAIPKDEAYRTLLTDAVRHHGIGTAKDIIDYFRLNVPTARPILAGLVDAGVVDEVEVPGWRDPVFVDPGAVRPRRIEGATLLSPFDPLVWCRERAERLFDFRYRIEIYVPEAKRTYGYYVLPFLMDDAMVARVDVKADRKAGRLLVRSAFIEQGASKDEVSRRLGGELERFARWLGLEEISVSSKGNLARPLRSVL